MRLGRKGVSIQMNHELEKTKTYDLEAPVRCVGTVIDGARRGLVIENVRSVMVGWGEEDLHAASCRTRDSKKRAAPSELIRSGILSNFVVYQHSSSLPRGKPNCTLISCAPTCVMLPREMFPIRSDANRKRYTREPPLHWCLSRITLQYSSLLSQSKA